MLCVRTWHTQSGEVGGLFGWPSHLHCHMASDVEPSVEPILLWPVSLSSCLSLVEATFTQFIIIYQESSSVLSLCVCVCLTAQTNHHSLIVIRGERRGKTLISRVCHSLRSPAINQAHRQSSLVIDPLPLHRIQSFQTGTFLPLARKTPT